MAQTRLNRLNISTIKRTARERGPTSSDAWNDSFDEIVADLTNLYNEWNNYLEPLTATIPDGTDDTDIDAFENGLDGANLYVDSDATSLVNPTYYSTTDTRPYTVLEIFDDLYEQIDALEATLSAQINGVVFSAASINVLDTGGYFTASNVEDVLAELGADVASFAGTYLPIPGGTMTGNIDLAAHHLVFSSAFISAGNNTPEGALAAPVGSLFLRLNGGANTTLYVKESGGSTVNGWVGK